MTEPEQALDYERIIADYDRSLVDTLRGFSAGVEGLELWVPSEDPLVSLCHMLDAAAAGGRRRLAVRFGAASARRMNVDAVREAVGRFGRARVMATVEGVTVVVEEIVAPVSMGKRAGKDSRPSPLPSPAANRGRGQSITGDSSARDLSVVPEAYVRALAAVPEPLVVAERDGSSVVVVGRDGEIELHLRIGRETNLIEAASFLGACTPQQQALLGHFCRVLLQLPILEAAHHGAIRLESALRDPGAPPPVPGVVTPRSAHPMFELPARLITAALAEYRARTGYSETESRYDRRPAAAWLAAPEAQRFEWVQAALDRAAVSLSLAAGELHLSAIEHDVRVVVALPSGLSSAQQQQALMQLERRLQAEVDPRLEVYAGERKDRNKLRRLALAK